MAEIETLTITYEGKPRELKMTHGLKRRLAGILPTPEKVGILALDYELSDLVVMEVLRPRAVDGQPNTNITPELFQTMTEDGTLESDAYELIMYWVQKIVLDFFMLRMEKTLEVETRLQKAYPVLASKVSQLGLTGLAPTDLIS